MLQKLLAKQKKGLDHFFANVDLEMLDKIVAQIKTCKGTIFFSGVGKSAHIAKKIAATLVSTGTRSSFLCPTHALHGDMGIVRGEDHLFMLSKSGETKELIDLLPHIQKKEVFVMAAISRPDSTLAKFSDMSIQLPVLEELCPLDLAPTTSSVVQLLLGDLIGMALMHAKGFAMPEFAANHPGGLLGQKISMKVSDVMLKGDLLPLCKPNDRLIDTLHILSMKRSGCLLVCDESKKLLGVFTDGDMRRAIEQRGSGALQETLSTLMTAQPLTTESEFLVLDAMRAMEGSPSKLVTVLPVLERGSVVGLLRLHDILQKNLS